MPAPHNDRDLMDAVGDRLRLSRQALGLSQVEFSQRAGIAANTYNQYERGKKLPSINNAVAICDAHGLTLDWLFRDDPGNLPYKLASAIQALKDARSNAT